MNFEICALNIQSALAAQEAGAQRIELCSALDVGGLTPSPGLIRHAVEALSIPVHVLIRPREGDFCYDLREVAVMCEDIRFCREAGAAGVVIGALTEHRQLDRTAVEAMLGAAGTMDVTFHRAFDYTAEPFDTLDTLIELGFKRVLSSGQAADAYQGRFMLKKLIEHAHGRIEVMPGGGINVHNIADVVAFTGAQNFHFTGKKKIANARGQADIPGLESWFWQSDVDTIRKIIGAAQ